MAKDKAIWVEGEKELFVNMQRSMDGSIKAAREGLQKAALKIVADAVQNIQSNKIWNTGALANSGKVQKVEGDEDAIDAGFFSDKGEGYAAYVEYGRRAGKMPPWDMLAAWAQKKLRLNPKEAKSVGFLIARKIAKKGTRPHPFFAPAVKKNEKEVTRAIQNAVKESIK